MRPRSVVLALLAAGAAWALIVLVAVPAVIRQAWRGESLPVLNGIFEGRDVHPVEEYIASWWPIARTATLWLIAAVAAVALLAALGRFLRRPAVRDAIAQWLFAGPPFSTKRDIGLIVWLGVVLGFLEFVARRVRYAVDHEFLMWSDPDAVWMTPIAGAVALLLLYVPLALAPSRRSRPLTFRATLSILIALGVFGVLRAVPGIAAAALAVFAMGTGVVAARAIAARPDRFRRIARLSTAPALALCVLIGIGMHRIASIRERDAMRALPPAAAGAKNVLLLILDTVRAQSLGLYGHPLATSPRIDRFARTGLVFDDAYAPSSWTLPTHATMFTGRGPLDVRVDWAVPLDATYPTLAGFLADNGYVTGGFVANLSYTTRASGLARGFVHYEDYPVSIATLLSTTWWTRTIGALWPNLYAGDYGLVRKWAPELNADLLDWLDAVRDRPFFAFVNYFEAHAPYRPFPDFEFEVPAADSVPARHSGWMPRSEEQRDELERYLSAIASLDHHVGALLDSLAARGLMDNTVVIIASDHGEQFGSHGWEGHGNSLYSPVLRVPLIIAGPGIAPGRVSGAAGLRHIPATIAAEIGRADDAPFPGRPLTRTTRLDEGTFALPHDRILSHFVPRRRPQVLSLIADDLHYIRNGDGSERLYDLSEDPSETINLADSVSHRSALEQLRGQVNAELAAARPPAGRIAGLRARPRGQDRPQ